MRYLILLLLGFSCNYLSKVKVPNELVQKDQACSEYREEILFFGNMNSDPQRKFEGGELKAIEFLNKFNQSNYSTEIIMVEMMQELEANCTKPLLERYSAFTDKLKCSLAFYEIIFFKTLFQEAKIESWSKSTLDLLEEKALNYAQGLLQRPTSGIGLTGAFTILEGLDGLGRKISNIDKIKTLRKNFDNSLIALRRKNRAIDFESCKGANVIFEEVRLVKKTRDELIALRAQ